MLLQKPKKKLQELLGVKTIPGPRGRDPQEGHCSLAGRAFLVRTILYDNKSIADAARQFDVHPRTVRRFLKKHKVTTLALAPCSPDTNPIELVFAWMKNYVRGRLLRTKEDIVAA